MKIFLSFHFDRELKVQENFVYRVSYYLRKQAKIEPYCYTGDPNDSQWRASVGRAVMKCDKFVLFVGGKLGNQQRTEAERFLKEHDKTIVDDALSVRFSNACELPSNLFQFKPVLNVDEAIDNLQLDALTDKEEELFDTESERCAKSILDRFLTTIGVAQPWIPADGLPVGYPFGYEKKIIEEFVKGNGYLLSSQHLAQGCPIKWPKVRMIGEPDSLNPILVEERGEDRDQNSIIADVMGRNHGSGHCLMREGRELSFPEAGPRKKLYYPRGGKTLKVGIVVSGGIAPGINAVITGIVQRHYLYHKRQVKDNRANLEIYMYRDGLEGIRRNRIYRLYETILKDQSTLGGSMINTSRFDDLLENKDQLSREGLLTAVVRNLEINRIDILYVIGGDGSMRAAHAIWTRAQEMHKSRDLNRMIAKTISLVAIPKTMDNDVLWVWQSFGFLSAVEKAKEFIVQLNTEAKSNPRLCIVQLFGSDSGFVVSHAALASGACMAALIPEVNFTMKKLSSDITKRMHQKYIERDDVGNDGQSPYGLVLLGETAIPQDVEDYIDNPDYPKLGLEEEEKEAIRKFMGSSLLCRNDILNWRALADEFRNLPQLSLGQRILKFLSPDVKAMFDDNANLSDNNRKSIILAFNQILKDENFYEENYFNNRPFTTELTEVKEILDQVKGMTGTSDKRFRGEEIQLLVQRLMTVPVSCEAREIVNLLETKSLKESNSWKDIPSRENLPLLQRLRRRIVEKFNRLLLELALSDKILARGSSIQRDRRVQGQTPDELRTGGLKIVSRVLKKDIRQLPDPEKYWYYYRVFVNEPRHLIRAIAPSVSDVIFGQRLGILAVDNAMAGFTDFMVSQWLTEYVMVPLKLAVLGRKRVPHNGIFWKSVLAGTGQAPDMIL